MTKPRFQPLNIGHSMTDLVGRVSEIITYLNSADLSPSGNTGPVTGFIKFRTTGGVNTAFGSISPNWGGMWFNGNYEAGVGWTCEDQAQPIWIARFTGDTFAVSRAPAGAGVRAAEMVLQVSNTGQLFERTRSTAVGEWIAPVFANTDYWGSGSMTVSTVGAGTTVRYTLVGKTMFINFVIGSITLAGVASPYWYIKVPGGFTIAANSLNPYLGDNGERFLAYCYAVQGETGIRLYRDLTGSVNWTVGGGAVTQAYGQITFEIQ